MIIGLIFGWFRHASPSSVDLYYAALEGRGAPRPPVANGALQAGLALSLHLELGIGRNVDLKAGEFEVLLGLNRYVGPFYRDVAGLGNCYLRVPRLYREGLARRDLQIGGLPCPPSECAAGQLTGA